MAFTVVVARRVPRFPIALTKFESITEFSNKTRNSKTPVIIYDPYGSKCKEASTYAMKSSSKASFNTEAAKAPEIALTAQFNI